MYLEKYDNKLELRNNQVIRNMFCEICCVICNSVKTKSLSFSKIKEAKFLVNENPKIQEDTENKKKVILNAHFFDDEDKEKLQKNILEKIQGLGYELISA